MAEIKVEVITTGESQARGIRIVEFKSVVPEGVKFSVTPERAAVLAGDNKWHVVFATKVEPKAVKPADAKAAIEPFDKVVGPTDSADLAASEVESEETKVKKHTYKSKKE